MTLVEAIRATWHWSEPIPTTIAECTHLASSTRGFGAPVGPDDRYGVQVMFVGGQVIATLVDHRQKGFDGRSTHLASVEWSFREFLDAMNDGQMELAL